MLSTGVGGGGNVETTDWAAVADPIPPAASEHPEDIAGTAIFLASRAGAFIVGETIVCDGGVAVG